MRSGWCSGQPAGDERYRVSCSACDEVRPVIRDSVGLDNCLYCVRRPRDKRHNGWRAEEIRRSQVSNVQGMALQLLGIVHQYSQLVRLFGNLDAQCGFHRLGRGKRMCD